MCAAPRCHGFVSARATVVLRRPKSGRRPPRSQKSAGKANKVHQRRRRLAISSQEKEEEEEARREGRKNVRRFANIDIVSAIGLPSSDDCDAGDACDARGASPSLTATAERRRDERCGRLPNMFSIICFVCPSKARLRLSFSSNLSASVSDGGERRLARSDWIWRRERPAHLSSGSSSSSSRPPPMLAPAPPASPATGGNLCGLCTIITISLPIISHDGGQFAARLTYSSLARSHTGSARGFACPARPSHSIAGHSRPPAAGQAEMDTRPAKVSVRLRGASSAARDIRAERGSEHAAAAAVVSEKSWHEISSVIIIIIIIFRTTGNRKSRLNLEPRCDARTSAGCFHLSPGFKLRFQHTQTHQLTISARNSPKRRRALVCAPEFNCKRFFHRSLFCCHSFITLKSRRRSFCRRRRRRRGRTKSLV